MDSAPVTPLTKEETKLLLSLVKKSKIINKKATNATNEQKNEEWQRIATEFNVVVTTSCRTPQQLRLKWMSLKKKSRKRIVAKVLKNIKNDNGGPAYIASENMLDQDDPISGGIAVHGLPAYYGGDSEREIEEHAFFLYSSQEKENHRAAREKAIADYYVSKTKLLKASYKNLLLRNEKLKLELQLMQMKDCKPPHSPEV